MIGVNFQPGSQDRTGGSPGNGGGGLQEAIKVLSLRLPKTVGAQAVAPQGLLTSQGGGGSRVDSVVNQVISRLFPNGGSMPSFGTAPPMPSAPDFGAMSGPMPSFSGGPSPLFKEPTFDAPRISTPKAPRVVVDSPMNPGDFMVGGDGRPTSPGGVFGELPSFPPLDGSGAQPPASIGTLPSFNPWGGGGGYEDPKREPMF